MPFIVGCHIVIDAEAHTAIDKHVGYNILNQPSIPPHIWVPEHVVPPPTPKKPQVLPPKTLETASEPALAGYLLPGPVMAAVCECIETISFQETLKKKDADLKQKYADCFPLRLLDTTDDLPDHNFHRMWLKDPNKVTKGQGYSAPKKYHESWKKLIDEHLAAGHIRPSSSEHASPAFVSQNTKTVPPTS